MKIVYTEGMPACGHPLCPLAGEGCSLDTGLSRGCRTGPRTAAPFAPEVIAEVAALLAQLGPPLDAADDGVRRAAARLAFVFRREAREGRSLLVLAADDAGELEPELAARLETLCRRRVA